MCYFDTYTVYRARIGEHKDPRLRRLYERSGESGISLPVGGKPASIGALHDENDRTPHPSTACPEEGAQMSRSPKRRGIGKYGSTVDDERHRLRFRVAVSAHPLQEQIDSSIPKLDFPPSYPVSLEPWNSLSSYGLLHQPGRKAGIDTDPPSAQSHREQVVRRFPISPFLSPEKDPPSGNQELSESSGIGNVDENSRPADMDLPRKPGEPANEPSLVNVSTEAHSACT